MTNREKLQKALLEAALELGMLIDTKSGEVIILTGISPQEVDRLLGWL